MRDARREYRTPAKATAEEGMAAWAEVVVEDRRSLCDPPWSGAAFGFEKGRVV